MEALTVTGILAALTFELKSDKVNANNKFNNNICIKTSDNLFFSFSSFISSIFIITAVFFFIETQYWIWNRDKIRTNTEQSSTVYTQFMWCDHWCRLRYLIEQNILYKMRRFLNKNKRTFVSTTVIQTDWPTLRFFKEQFDRFSMVFMPKLFLFLIVNPFDLLCAYRCFDRTNADFQIGERFLASISLVFHADQLWWNYTLIPEKKLSYSSNWRQKYTV